MKKIIMTVIVMGALIMSGCAYQKVYEMKDGRKLVESYTVLWYAIPSSNISQSINTDTEKK